MAADIVAGGADRGCGRRMAFQRQRTAEHGQRQIALCEQPHDPPEADAAAVGEHALGREVATLHAGVQHAVLGQPPFRCGVAVRHRWLRPLLVVQHEIHREPRAAGPFRVGRMGAIADQVSVHGGQIALIATRWPLVDWSVIRAEKPRHVGCRHIVDSQRGLCRIAGAGAGLGGGRRPAARIACPGTARAVEVAGRVAVARAVGGGAEMRFAHRCPGW